MTLVETTVTQAAVRLPQKLGACPGARHSLLGMEQCTQGPAYWCKNMETATKCDVSRFDFTICLLCICGRRITVSLWLVLQAVAHCRRHVWV